MNEDILGILLCGGKGTRLDLLTRQCNKHMLPIFNEPMLCYGLRSMIQAGIKDIVVVVGGESVGAMVQLLGDGKFLGARSLYITHQAEANGIAGALSLCEKVAHGRKICVYLGDNIIEEDLSPIVEQFKSQPSGARILLKEVPDPKHFGVAEFDANNKLINIIEKPQNPPSKLAVIGCYLYDSEVWQIGPTLKPSRRGELEITDINTFYLKNRVLEYNVLSGFWLDSGSSFLHLLRGNIWSALRSGTDVRQIVDEVSSSMVAPKTTI